MILHQTIRSARAEKRALPVPRRMTRLGLTALLTAVLSLPSVAAWGVDRPEGNIGAAITRHQIGLPPIPYLDSMPWMQWNAPAPGLKTDILIAPGVVPSDTIQIPQGRIPTKPMIS